MSERVIINETVPKFEWYTWSLNLCFVSKESHCMHSVPDILADCPDQCILCGFPVQAGQRSTVWLLLQVATQEMWYWCIVSRLLDIREVWDYHWLELYIVYGWTSNLLNWVRVIGWRFAFPRRWQQRTSPDFNRSRIFTWCTSARQFEWRTRHA